MCDRRMDEQTPSYRDARMHLKRVEVQFYEDASDKSYPTQW